MKRERPTLSHARNKRDNPLTHPLYQPLHERKQHNSRLPYSTIVTWDLHLFDHHHHRSLRQKAHKAITLSAQPPLSLAANLATFQLFHPALPLSLSTVLLQVVFGLPLALRPSGMYPNIFPLRSKGAPAVNKKLLSAYSYLTETEKKSVKAQK